MNLKIFYYIVGVHRESTSQCRPCRPPCTQHQYLPPTTTGEDSEVQSHPQGDSFDTKCAWTLVFREEYIACMCNALKSLFLHPQELIRNKARNGQNCCLLEEAYAMMSALPQRSENTHHVSMIENYPATLEVLGEPIRQVDGVTLVIQHSD